MGQYEGLAISVNFASWESYLKSSTFWFPKSSFLKFLVKVTDQQSRSALLKIESWSMKRINMLEMPKTD